MTTTTPHRLAITAGPAPRGPSPRPAAVVVAAAAAVRATPEADIPAPPAAPTRRLVPPPAPAALSVVLELIGAGCAEVVEPVNITVSAATHDAHVHVATAAQFRDWCKHLRIPVRAVRRTHDFLGTAAEATTTRHGWALHVRLFGNAVQEL